MKRYLTVALMFLIVIGMVGCVNRNKPNKQQYYSINSNSSTVVTSNKETSSETVTSDVTSSQPTSSEPVSSNKENNTTSSSSATSSKPSVSKNTSSKPKTTSSTPKSTSSTTQTKPPTAPTTSSTVETPKQLIVPNASQLAYMETEIARLVNEYRKAQGLNTLTVDTRITQGARIRAKESSTKGYFGHYRPDGTIFATVLEEVGFLDYTIGSENLTGFSNAVINQDYFNCTTEELYKVAKEMFDGWKASPDHNKNMIDSNIKKMGIGVFAQYEVNLLGIKEVAFYGIQIFTD